MGRIVVLACVAMLMSGCVRGDSSLQSATHQGVTAELVQGRTTRQDALGLFGKPSSTSTTESGELWQYDMTRESESPDVFLPMVNLVSAHGSNELKRLDLFFTADGVLKDWLFSETTVDHYHGI